MERKYAMHEYWLEWKYDKNNGKDLHPYWPDHGPEWFDNPNYDWDYSWYYNWLNVIKWGFVVEFDFDEVNSYLQRMRGYDDFIYVQDESGEYQTADNEAIVDYFVSENHIISRLFMDGTRRIMRKVPKLAEENMPSGWESKLSISEFEQIAGAISAVKLACENNKRDIRIITTQDQNLDNLQNDVEDWQPHVFNTAVYKAYLKGLKKEKGIHIEVKQKQGKDIQGIQAELDAIKQNYDVDL